MRPVFRHLSGMLSLLCAALLAACGDDTAQSEYSRLRAAFFYTPVNTVAPLTQAMGSFGEYCVIRADMKSYSFSSLTHVKPHTVARTADAAYRRYVCISGFIVGRSAQTEIGTAVYPLLCYDLACPNCYREDIYKDLSLASGGKATCPRCRRTYDLDNKGIVVAGEKGRKLERYRMSYDGITIAVAN